MQTLGLVDSLVTSKSSFVDTDSFIAAYKVRNVMYYNDQNTTEKQVLHKAENDSDGHSIDSIDPAADVIDYVPHYVGRLVCARDEWQAAADKAEPLALLEAAEADMVADFLLALLLCHEA